MQAALQHIQNNYLHFSICARYPRAGLLSVVPILADDPRRGSKCTSQPRIMKPTRKYDEPHQIRPAIFACALESIRAFLLGLARPAASRGEQGKLHIPHASATSLSHTAHGPHRRMREGNRDRRNCATAPRQKSSRQASEARPQKFKQCDRYRVKTSASPFPRTCGHPRGAA